jgi:anaerobic selenocysteine-containing dehydrogenase
MPEYNQTGESTYFATTCRECPAGCGVLVRTFEGRAIKIDGNPQHPISRGKICARGVTGVQGLYNPDRVTGPRKQTRGETNFVEIEWQEAIDVVSAALSNLGSTAFLLGGAPDHLADLVGEITGAAPTRYSTLGMFEGRATLVEAANRVFGRAQVPYFNLADADLILSFGAGFLEEWLSPLTYARQFSQFRQKPAGRGHLVVIEPRQSQTGGVADEWVNVPPGTEGMLALALGRMVAEARGLAPSGAFDGVDITAITEATGVSVAGLRALAERFAAARHAVAVPGGSALGHANGLETAQAVLALNTLSQSPSVFFAPAAEDEQPAPAGAQQMRDLVARMNDGGVQTLLIHGVNPVFELPKSYGFEDALAKVKTVIAFSTFPDETAAAADYVFPDHFGLESFGYQRSPAGADRPLVSAAQPVVVPLYNTQSTADVLIAAAKAAGIGLDYNDEVEFIQTRLRGLVEGNSAAGIYRAADIPTFWASFLQYGGWWTQAAQLEPAGEAAGEALTITLPEAGEGELNLIIYPNRFGDGSVANRPWIQELPDGLTTVTWNSFVLIHPRTAEELKILNNDVVRVSSQYGWVEAVAYVYPAIRPDTVAMPFGQGHTALGRWAAGRGSNPAFVMGARRNAAGDLAYADLRVTIEPTGRRRPLATLESREGVYGEGAESQH